jgi:Ca2+-binding RTX toxin-like protein
MAAYAITTANWNDPAFWASINVSSAGHTLDFSALPSNFTVITNLSGIITITDGTTVFTIGEAGVGGQSANFGGSTLLDYFTTLTSGAGTDTINGSSGNDPIAGGNDTITGGSGAGTFDGDAGDDFAFGLVMSGAGGRTNARCIATIPNFRRFSFSESL